MDVIACGELLIDFVSTQAGVSLAQAPAFKKAPGGALANVAVGVARLGYRAGFIGQVGEDEFAHFLADTLHSRGNFLGKRPSNHLGTSKRSRICKHYLALIWGPRASKQ